MTVVVTWAMIGVVALAVAVADPVDARPGMSTVAKAVECPHL